MTTIKAYALIIVALVLGLGIGYISNNGATKIGGTVENYPVQFVNGLKAGTNNQFNIDSTGSITSAKTSTTTLSLGNTGVGKICLYNGSQYSIISFAAGSTTVGVATSTSCN